MKTFSILLFFFILLSCSKNNNTLQNKCESFPSSDVHIGEWQKIFNSSPDSIRNIENNFPDKLLAQLDSISKTDSIKTQAELRKILDLWNEVKALENDYGFSAKIEADTCFLRNWFKLNFDLLKLTAEPKFTDELERVVFEMSKQNKLSKSDLKQFVYTKLNDQSYINFFIESSAEYEHTTGGTIRISQETSYPNDGHVHLRFETSDKRFVELFIFIPSWAGNATVTVGGVKYKAVPGEYCRVARMWKSGNSADIFIENREIPSI